METLLKWFPRSDLPSNFYVILDRDHLIFLKSDSLVFSSGVLPMSQKTRKKSSQKSLSSLETVNFANLSMKSSWSRKLKDLFRHNFPLQFYELRRWHWPKWLMMMMMSSRMLRRIYLNIKIQLQSKKLIPKARNQMKRNLGKHYA